jgi:hypothetical protein
VCGFGSINVCVYIPVPADFLQVACVTSVIATGNKIVHMMVPLCLPCAALVNVCFVNNIYGQNYSQDSGIASSIEGPVLVSGCDSILALLSSVFFCMYVLCGAWFR